MEKKCECTPQYPRCEEGWRLEGESMAAQIAWQQAPVEKLRELHDAFSACLRRYFEHVRDCSIHGQQGQ